MKCPNCKQKVGYGYRNCPNCNHNLSFSTKVRSSENLKNIKAISTIPNTLSIGFIIGTAVTIVALLLFFYFFSFIGYFNATFALIHSILKWMLISGIVIFIICLLLTIFKKRFKLLKYVWIISIVLICVPVLSMKLVNINGNISLKDYSKVEYIEIGSEKIPSLYSVVGKRDIILSDETDDNVDEELNITTDNIVILYAELSIEDKVKYSEALIDCGFSVEMIYNSDEEEYIQFYLKNNESENEFYSVNISGLSIVYARADGRYQDILDKE